MIWNKFEENKKFILNQYSIDGWNTESDLSSEKLEVECAKLYETIKELPKEIVKARIFEFIMDNAQIEINPCNWFQGKINHRNILIRLRNEWKSEIDNNEVKCLLEENAHGQSHFAYKGEVDFSHTCPDWNAIVNLGVTGLLNRVEVAAKQENLSETQKNFYLSCIIVYKAVIRFIKRLSDRTNELSADNGIMSKVSESLYSLTQREPQSMLEVMQLTFIFYYLQTFVEGVNVRSIGGIDRLYYSFYKNDLESGAYTDSQIRELVDYYFFNYSALGAIANTPFYLCGEDKNGRTVLNELTYLFVEEYDKLSIIDPKIHIRYTEDLPDEFLKKILSIIADGRNSIVFLNDEIIFKSLEGVGIAEKDAKDYVPIGCYEPAVMGKEVPCTCSGRINIPKAVELAVNNGCDLMDGVKIYNAHTQISTFEDFVAEVKAILKFFADQTMALINGYEENYIKINPAPLFSATMEECVKNGKDAYAGGAKYNNTSINAFGIADAVDSIIAVKKAVFDEKRLTLREFGEVLKNNWSGNEELQLICKNSYPKYGNNIAEADEIMLELTEHITTHINNKPNGRGGVYRSGLFSIDWYTDFGRRTGALPNGRKAGEPISKNLNAVIGQDKGGVTDLINSVTKIDYTKTPNGVVLDLLLHSSAAKGEDGRLAMLGVLKTYMKTGGFGLQINVLNPDVLKKAQAQPDKYKNLQVRLCGWNVYFVNLNQREQNEFIKMSETAASVL